MLRPVVAWNFSISRALTQGHVGGVVNFESTPTNRRCLDRKNDAKDTKTVPERQAIIDHNTKFEKTLKIVTEGIPSASLIKDVPEYRDVVRILGLHIHKRIPVEDRDVKGPLRYWVVRKLMQQQRQRKQTNAAHVQQTAFELLKGIHVPRVCVWWPTFDMCHPVYCVEARGNPVGRLTMCSREPEHTVLWTSVAAGCLWGKAVWVLTTCTWTDALEHDQSPHTGWQTIWLIGVYSSGG